MTNLLFVFLMYRHPPRTTRTDTLFPYTPLFRSGGRELRIAPQRGGVARFRKSDAMLLAGVTAQANLVEAVDPLLDDEMPAKRRHAAHVNRLGAGDHRLPFAGTRRIGLG